MEYYNSFILWLIFEHYFTNVGWLPVKFFPKFDINKLTAVFITGAGILAGCNDVTSCAQ